MNNSHKKLVVVRIAFSVLLGVAAVLPFILRCRTASQTTQPANQPCTPKTGKGINYKGVSFSFDLSLASQIKAETIPAATEGKPSDIWPEHPAFTLIGYRPLVHAPKDSPQIRVFQIAKFKDAMRIAGREMGRNTVPPNNDDWSSDIDVAARTLHRLLTARPKAEHVRAVIGKHAGIGCYDIPQVPFLPEWESCQPFVAHVRYIDFKNGKGVFFLTQWENETEQITNQGLEYAFQGITNDGRYWVYAEFSVSTPVLPQGDEPDVIAWTEKNYLLDWTSNEFQSYIRPVVAKLELLPAARFQPNLELLERLIQSLEVQPK